MVFSISLSLSLISLVQRAEERHPEFPRFPPAASEKQLQPYSVPVGCEKNIHPAAQCVIHRPSDGVPWGIKRFSVKRPSDHEQCPESLFAQSSRLSARALS